MLWLSKGEDIYVCLSIPLGIYEVVDLSIILVGVKFKGVKEEEYYILGEKFNWLKSMLNFLDIYLTGSSAIYLSTLVFATYEKVESMFGKGSFLKAFINLSDFWDSNKFWLEED